MGTPSAPHFLLFACTPSPKVTVAVFWGRERYVSILWRYLERNLRVNQGIIDEVLLITKNRDDEAGAIGARAILNAAISKCVATRMHDAGLRTGGRGYARLAPGGGC